VLVKQLAFGDGEKVMKGQFVVSLANPFAAGYYDGSPSASWGIISNIRRRAPGKPVGREQDRAKMTIHHLGTLLQIDARLNLGCSGGALIDLKGELIGLTSSQAALTGGESAGGFAVPMNARIKQIVQRLKEGREVEYGFLGVQFIQEGYRGQGVHVRVLSGSPANKAGIPESAIIRAVDGIPVRETDDLLYTISTLMAGSKARLEIVGDPIPKIVTLVKLYVPGPVVAANRPPLVHGLRVDYTSVLSQRTNSGFEIPNGVFVSEIIPGSPAEKAKLKDAIITHVNDQPVSTPNEFYRVAAQKQGPVKVRLNRGEEVKLD
jgi:S1-C subfamily serine protease